jgi:CBS domain-containing protein
LSVADVMSRGLVIAKPGEPVRTVASRMHSAGVGAVLVVDDAGRLVGLFTERDLLRLVAEGSSLDEPVEKHMTREPTVVKPEATLMEAGELMVRLGVRHLPVVGPDGRPLGVISLRDVCQALLGE